jgi:RNase P subunit RPR2
MPLLPPERKILRCKQCNSFLGAMAVVDYLIGSKVLVELEFHCCRCGADNSAKVQIAPIPKQNPLPWL